MGMITMTPEIFGGAETKHGRMVELDDGTWVALGHLSENQFFEAYNEANRAMDTGAWMTEAPHGIVQKWGILQALHPADEWIIRFVDRPDVPQAFGITLLPVVAAASGGEGKDHA